MRTANNKSAHWVISNCRFAATPEEIAAILAREFPAFASAAQAVSSQTNNVSIARWLMRNVIPQSGIQELPNAITKLTAFDRNKQKIKANGNDTDISKYDYASLSKLVDSLTTMNKSKTQQRRDLPKEIMDLITVATTKALRYVPQAKEYFEGNRQAIEKSNIFNWFSQRYFQKLENEDVKKIVDRSRLLGHSPDDYIARHKSATIAGFVEDKTNYVTLVPDFYIWKYSDPVNDEKVETEIGVFSGKDDLSKFIDSRMTPEQAAVRYQIDDNATEGLEIITEGPFRAIKITEWNEHFAQELCKSANWCIKDKRAFDNYGIGPDNPVYLLSKGNQQLGMMGLKSGQIKDVNDAPIDAGMAEELYPLIKKISETSGSAIPLNEDFNILLETPYATDALTHVRIASFDDISDLLHSIKNRKIALPDAKQNEIASFIAHADVPMSEKFDFMNENEVGRPLGKHLSSIFYMIFENIKKNSALHPTQLLSEFIELLQGAGRKLGTQEFRTFDAQVKKDALGLKEKIFNAPGISDNIGATMVQIERLERLFDEDMTPIAKKILDDFSSKPFQTISEAKDFCLGCLQLTTTLNQLQKWDLAKYIIGRMMLRRDDVYEMANSAKTRTEREEAAYMKRLMPTKTEDDIRSQWAKPKVSQWVSSNCRFATDSNYSSESEEYGYGKQLNFKELKKLHELWYRINQLQGKFSAKAEKAMMEAKAEFHMLADKLTRDTVYAFQNWLYAHTLPGWWIRTKKSIENNWENDGKIWVPDYMGGLTHVVIGERCAKAQLDQYQDIDLEEYVRGNEIMIGAMDFLASKGIETDAQFDDEAFRTIVNDDNLLSEYTMSLRQNPDFIEQFNPWNIYGNDWVNASENEQHLFMNALTDDIGQMAYKSFISIWPGYIEVAKNVQIVVDRLKNAMASPEDYNGMMTSLSLALNAAHNTGMMSEHVGLSDRQMDQLSNLNMDSEDAKIKRYMTHTQKWILSNVFA